MSPAVLEEHLSLLEARGLRGVTLAEAVRRPHDKNVALTFDDGYADFATFASPALMARGFRASFYTVTNDVGLTARWPGGEGRRMATWDELRDLGALGFEIGAHSHTHPNLDLLPLAAAIAEIETSRDLLREQLGNDVPGFCYPHGFYTRRVRSAVVDAGFAYACAVRHKMWHTDSDPFTIGRIVVQHDTTVDELEQWLSGEGLRRRPVPCERTMAAGFRSYRRLRSFMPGSWER